MNWIAIATLFIGLIAGTIAGYYLRALRDYYKRLQALVEDARYPKQRTHADRYRLEDMWAGADLALDNLELMELRARQEHDRQIRELEGLKKQFMDVHDRIVDARQSAPGDFPEEPKFANRKENQP